MQKIDDLIRKYLEGNLCDAECAELLNWLDKDQNNTDYFREFARTGLPEQNATIEKSWNALKVKRQLRESAEGLHMNRHDKGRKILHLSLLQITRYAALIVIGMITVLYAHNRIQDYLEDKQGGQWIHAETEAGQKTKIVLPDSTVVWLNSESVVSFSSNFETQRKRIIKLDGEAFFDVTDQGRSKFIVQCRDYNIEVKGTRFNVMAYKDFNRTETTLVEGAVQIIKGEDKLVLDPGERAIASRGYLTKSRAQVRQATLWKENKFYFDNVPFRELARRLERWYDVKITLADRSLDDIYYSGYFKNEETVWQVLDVIQITTPIVYERKQFREITISRKANSL